MTDGLTLSIEDLKLLIGELTIEVMGLRKENQLLKEMIAVLKETALSKAQNNKNKEAANP